MKPFNIFTAGMSAGAALMHATLGHAGWVLVLCFLCGVNLWFGLRGGGRA